MLFEVAGVFYKILCRHLIFYKYFILSVSTHIMASPRQKEVVGTLNANVLVVMTKAWVVIPAFLRQTVSSLLYLLVMKNQSPCTKVEKKAASSSPSLEDPGSVQILGQVEKSKSAENVTISKKEPPS